MKKLTTFLFTLVLFVSGANLWGDTPRPIAGQGAIFVDDGGWLTFTFWDNEYDTIWVYPSVNAGDFARSTPNGQYFVNAQDESTTIYAHVGGQWYWGVGLFRTSYNADCVVFDPARNNFWCYIGAGAASFHTEATVTNWYTGEEVRLSGQMTGVYRHNRGGFALLDEAFDISVN